MCDKAVTGRDSAFYNGDILMFCPDVLSIQFHFRFFHLSKHVFMSLLPVRFYASNEPFRVLEVGLVEAKSAGDTYKASHSLPAGVRPGATLRFGVLLGFGVVSLFPTGLPTRVFVIRRSYTLSRIHDPREIAIVL